MSIEIKRSDKYVDYNISATNNRGYITIDTSDWINKPWMFYELPALKFEIYTETDGELVKYKNFTREIRTYNPVYSPLGVLNVTIDIRNVPEEFILRITPIFDNDAIAARNMLIENGIEDGDIWGSDQDVPTQLFNLDLEFIECEGEYVPPTHEETITGVPPITFDGSTGEPLVSWTILGNGQQTGTPSPDNIIMPTFCGVRTGNLISLPTVTATIDGLTVSSNTESITISGNATTTWESNSAWKQFDFTLEAGEYTLSLGEPRAYQNGYAPRLHKYDDGSVLCDYLISPVTFTLSEKTHVYLAFYINDKQLSNDKWVFMLNLGSTALPYEPFGWAEKITCAGQTVPVYLGEVPTVRRVRKLVLTGEETWLSSGMYTGAVYAYHSQFPGIKPLTPIFCTHLAYAYESSYVQGTCKNDSNSVGLWIFDTTISPTGFKSYLAAQYAAGTPVTVWYVLATPETAIVNEPLAKIGTYADELHSEDAAVTIPTTKGQNTLTVDTDLQPSEMTITYIKEGQ